MKVGSSAKYVCRVHSLIQLSFHKLFMNLVDERYSFQKLFMKELFVTCQRLNFVDTWILRWYWQGGPIAHAFISIRIYCFVNNVDKALQFLSKSSYQQSNSLFKAHNDIYIYIYILHALSISKLRMFEGIMPCWERIWWTKKEIQYVLINIWFIVDSFL